MTSHWKVLNKCKLAHGFKECFSTVNSELFSTFQGARATCAFAPSSNFVRVDVGHTGLKCYLVRSQNLDGFGERFIFPVRLSEAKRERVAPEFYINIPFWGFVQGGISLSCLYAPLD